MTCRKPKGFVGSHYKAPGTDRESKDKYKNKGIQIITIPDRESKDNRMGIHLSDRLVIYAKIGQ